MKLLALHLFLLLSLFTIAQETETVYLSGTGAENTVDWEFYCSKGHNSGEWTSIPVPSCWEQQGFGSYDYGHVPFEKRLNETGRYRYQFNIPKDWEDNEITIVFDGVMTDAEVKINGKLAGPVHQGAFYQFRYDITKLLNIGKENQLEVFVKKHSDNESVSLAERKADFWIFGGIFRPVFLEAKPRTNIQRVAINARANGQFEADVYLTNAKNASQIRVDIKTLTGETQASFTADVDGSVSRVSGTFKYPKTWSPESPNLYQAVFNLLDKNEQVVHQHSERIGFRTIEVRESDGIYVNGVKIKMQGVNRHTFHPKYGRTSSKDLSITAVNLMKDMNMNAVRMSHYPPDKHFLYVCDSIGLLVIDELTAWQKPSYDDVVGRKLLEEMIARDVNHPSVIIWANGNEGGENNTLNDDFAELDIQQRTVIHPWQDYEKTNTLHYIDYNYLSLDGFSKRKIYFPTEFLHGLYDGGHGAGLDDYWLRMWIDPLCAGGFLWVFADESVERTDRNNELDSDGNHAPDGILGPYNEKEGSFYSIKEIWAPIQFEKRYITPDFNGIFNLENRYFFTNLNQCSLTAEWVSFSDPGQTISEIINSTEKLELDLAPGNNGQLKVNLPTDWHTFDALRITASDPHGRHLNTWSWPVKNAQIKANELRTVQPSAQPTLIETNAELKVTAGGLTFSIKKENGTISEIKNQGQLIPLSNGPVFVSREKKVKNVVHAFEENQLLIEVTYENEDHLKWTIYGNGLFDLEVAYEPSGRSQFAGITFDFPEENVAGMTWLGNGPYRVYKNRMKGVNFGLWEKGYNNTITGESGFIYPEFKGYHSEVYWAEIEGKTNPGFRVHVHSNDIFVRVLTPDEPEAPARTQLEYPSGDISFLHGINAIGTKFIEANRLGPQSTTNQFSAAKMHGGKLTIKLTFDFN